MVKKGQNRCVESEQGMAQAAIKAGERAEHGLPPEELRYQLHFAVPWDEINE